MASEPVMPFGRKLPGFLKLISSCFEPVSFYGQGLKLASLSFGLCKPDWKLNPFWVRERSPAFNRASSIAIVVSYCSSYDIYFTAQDVQKVALDKRKEF